MQEHLLRFKTEIAFGLLSVAVVVAIYFTCTSYQGLLQKRQELAERQALSSYIEQAAPLLSRLGGELRQAKSTKVDLMQEITQTTEDFAIPLDRIAPSKNDNLNIWFKQAKYEELVRWLWFLEMEQGFYISQLNLTRLPEDGWASGFLVVSADVDSEG